MASSQPVSLPWPRRAAPARAGRGHESAPGPRARACSGLWPLKRSSDRRTSLAARRTGLSATSTAGLCEEKRRWAGPSARNDGSPGGLACSSFSGVLRNGLPARRRAQLPDPANARSTQVKARGTHAGHALHKAASAHIPAAAAAVISLLAPQPHRMAAARRTAAALAALVVAALCLQHASAQAATGSAFDGLWRLTLGPQIGTVAVIGTSPGRYVLVVSPCCTALGVWLY